MLIVRKSRVRYCQGAVWDRVTGLTLVPELGVKVSYESFDVILPKANILHSIWGNSNISSRR